MASNSRKTERMRKEALMFLRKVSRERVMMTLRGVRELPVPVYVRNVMAMKRERATPKLNEAVRVRIMPPILIRWISCLKGKVIRDCYFKVLTKINVV